MAEENILDKFKVLDLLNGDLADLSTAEQLHPWRYSRSCPLTSPLMRVWDSKSGSQPDEHNRMNSRAPDQRLNTIESRRTSLTTHINHGNWTPTPYISFTSSPTTIEELAKWRRTKRGAQKLTAINPTIRLRNGLPILDLAAEMKYYNISNPYGERDKYCIDHYICLWQVTEKEIICHWDWSELAAAGNWYQDIVEPAFQNFNRNYNSEPGDSNMSALMDRLCLYGESPNVASYLNGVPDTFSKGRDYFSEDEFRASDDSADEEFDYDREDDWDTDDEAEEANATDNMIKIIEGDW